MKYLMAFLIFSFANVSGASLLNERACDSSIYLTYKNWFEEKHPDGGECAFDTAWVSEIKYQGQFFAVVDVHESACDIVSNYEAIVKNQTCEVISSQIIPAK